MEEFLFIREDWIDELIGTKTRHFAIDFSKKQVTFQLEDLCKEAASQALEQSGIEPGQIDLVVMSTATPDHLMPATVNLVADQLGLNGVPTYEIQAGCSGAIQGIEVAYRFLKSGAFSNALVIGGDVCNKYMDLNRDFKKLRSSELINYALFGDGAGAVVLSTQTDCDGIKIQNIINEFVGLDRKPGQVMNWFGFIPENVSDMGKREQRKKFQSAKEDYKAIEEHVPVMSKEVIDGQLQAEDWIKGEVDYFLPPQLSGNMTNKIVEGLEIDPLKAINCVAETGNNGNALPYIQLQALSQQMKSGERAVGAAIESSKWIQTGIALIKE
ncbi:3-oxoacyl-ACP synthase III family protein [Lentibacillus cibarius]|uniref:3-oxoacyl-ACP synthase III family protein n=2 Tax=Lentibacillus cibarius TaxID=2583219 RepID=A0A5S3QR82_9BACI|nr:3-oxoacyl-ACP synthase III family protein [Lentibacillus cibarius]